MDSKIRHILLCIFVSVFAVQVQAQAPDSKGEGDRERPVREIISPDRVAKKKTDRLKKVLNLTDKQYEKIYQLNLKEQRELFEANMERRPMMPPAVMPDDKRPTYRKAMKEGMPKEMRGRRPEGDRDMHRPHAGKMSAKDVQKYVKKKNKKMKKILTESQYDLWLGINQPRRADRPCKEKCNKER